MAVVQSVGFSELTTTDKPNGTLRNASPNPELQLMSTGRLADRASSPVNPKPSDLEGMTTRSTS